MTKREFMLQATLNGFVGYGHQTERIGGGYIVNAAEEAWNKLEAIRRDDERRSPALEPPPTATASPGPRGETGTSLVPTSVYRTGEFKVNADPGVDASVLASLIAGAMSVSGCEGGGC